MDPELQKTVQELAAAVEVVLNPFTPHEQRRQAHEMCEQFKETSPYCAVCGVMMSSKENKDIIRHFGLQLLEYCVKYKWNDMSVNDKVYIKENTMKLLQEGTHDILHEQTHIKDAVSRIVVEMIKREWPQQWPSLMQELSAICKLGATQSELVLMVFLRLAEDVIVFMTVPQQRRREILNGLMEYMPDLFDYFMETLQANYNIHKEMSSMADEALKKQGQVACRLVITVLRTLEAFVDWVNVSFITERNGYLLVVLCEMLSDDSLQVHAADCMRAIANRKQKLEDRKPNLVLFDDAPMSKILDAAVKASQAPLDEYHYRFLVKLCQVLTAVGFQLCVLWNSPEGVLQPANFEQYLTAILTFTNHPSQLLGSITQSLWVAFLRHEYISADPIFQSFIPKYIESTRTTLVKIGFPSQNNSPSCAYAKLDFDSDEDFYLFFTKYRAEIADTIRQATLISPDITFTFAANWLKMLLTKPVDIGEARTHCNQSSPAFLEWDAMTVCLESCMSRFHQADKPKPPPSEGIQLLRDVLLFETQDPLILSSLLSTISALFTFITYAPDILPDVLNKIFSSAVFNLEGQTKATRSKAVKNVRRHACCILIKICKQYPDLLLPGFDHLYTHIKQLSSDPEELSQMEKCQLTEALILISNQFKDFEKQCKFLGEILAPVKEIWMSPEMKESLWSTDKFLSYVGLDQPPVEPSSEDTCGINRSHIVHCISTILAVMKRSVWPECPEAAKNGGFVCGMSESGEPKYKNPVTPHILSMLESVLALSRTLNLLWTPENLARRHPAFQKAYDMEDAEKQVLLGIQPPCVDNTDATSCKHPLERMQSFIACTHNNCYHVLGNSGSSMGHEFYQVPNLAPSLLNSVFINLDAIPLFRIRPVIRVFLKPYVQSCPRECYTTAVIPLVSFLSEYMLQRLTKEWEVILKRSQQRPEDSEENPESQEVIDEQVVRQMTREYLEFLGMLLREKRSSGAADEMSVDEDVMSSVNINKEETISQLGMLVLDTENVYPSIVILVFKVMSWPDTKACGLSAMLAWKIVKPLVDNNKLTSDDVCHLLVCILNGLQLLGEHENILAALLTLLLHFYEKLRPRFPELYNVMLQVPGCQEKALKSFDEKLLLNQMKAKNMKDTMRKLVQGIVGKNVSQLFRREENIKNLPPLYGRTRRPKPKPSVVEDSAEIGLCALFTPKEDTPSTSAM